MIKTSLLVTIGILVCLGGCRANGAEMNDAKANQIADAIKQIENSSKYPYGVKSLPIKGNNQIEREAYGRKICINTIKLNYQRWQNTDKSIDYLTFLGLYYCPNVEGNRQSYTNWIRNIHALIKVN